MPVEISFQATLDISRQRVILEGWKEKDPEAATPGPDSNLSNQPTPIR